MRARAAIRQEGAALVVVLLLVATLSFIVLAIGETTMRAADRASNVRTRSELLWRAVGVEALAAEAIQTALRENPEKITPQSPFVARPLDAPMEDGGARIAFEDRSRCFNVNSLVSANEEGRLEANEAAAQELDLVLTAAGADAFAPGKLAATIADWIDADQLQSPGGAEDNRYTALPTPYSTGGVLLADVSEIRAMADIDRSAFRGLRPYLCARSTTAPSILNVNMLTEDEAPLLVGVLGGRMPLPQAGKLILDRPPGGYETVEAFWANPVLTELALDDAVRERVRVTPHYVGARALIALGDAELELDLTFEVGQDGAARLLSRRIGWFE